MQKPEKVSRLHKLHYNSGPSITALTVTDHNETNSLSFMQLNLHHMWGDMMHYRLPSDISGGRVPLSPAGFTQLPLNQATSYLHHASFYA